jgi:ring-1,2-phenylacetyl-CoA epoxidase subunit PaaC
MNTNHFLYALHLADNALVLGQRHAEWTGHGPVLEQDIAITNISLDLLGQARLYYQFAARLYNDFGEAEKATIDKYIPHLWKSYGRALEEDDLAFLRNEHQYLNLQLVELPRGDWAQTVLRQFFFSAYQAALYKRLVESASADLSAIAEKSVKETTYHLRWSGEWVVRLGDGTEESRRRIQSALEDQWAYTGELFTTAPYEPIDNAALKDSWLESVKKVFALAELELPASTWMQSGGKEGRHTEYLGLLLAEMQYLQRAYPNATW